MTMNGNNGQALAVREERAVARGAANEAGRDLIKRQLCPGASDLEMEYFLSVSRELGLSPLSREIYAIMRRTKVNGEWVDKMTIQIGIDGFRGIGARTGRFGGMRGPYWCGTDGEWKDVWLSEEPPAAAKVDIVLADTRETVTGIATWREFKQETPARPAGQNRKTGESWPARPAQLSEMWQKMGAHMLAKCAEAQAWRKALPSQTQQLLSTARVEFTPTEITSLPPVTVHLNPSDTEEDFWDEAARAGWDEAETCRSLAVADRDGLEREAERRGGWAQMTMALRALLAKLTRDAILDQSNPPRDPNDRASDLLYDPSEIGDRAPDASPPYGERPPVPSNPARSVPPQDREQPPRAQTQEEFNAQLRGEPPGEDAPAPEGESLAKTSRLPDGAIEDAPAFPPLDPSVDTLGDFLQAALEAGFPPAKVDAVLGPDWRKGAKPEQYPELWGKLAEAKASA